jgi:hypothetical protein
MHAALSSLLSTASSVCAGSYACDGSQQATDLESGGAGAARLLYLSVFRDDQAHLLPLWLNNVVGMRGMRNLLVYNMGQKARDMCERGWRLAAETLASLKDKDKDIKSGCVGPFQLGGGGAGGARGQRGTYGEIIFSGLNDKAFQQHTVFQIMLAYLLVTQPVSSPSLATRYSVAWLDPSALVLRDPTPLLLEKLGAYDVLAMDGFFSDIPLIEGISVVTPKKGGRKFLKYMLK